MDDRLAYWVLSRLATNDEPGGQMCINKTDFQAISIIQLQR
jgi:hypothetical protein